MSLKGFPTQEKVLDSVDGVSTELTDCRAEFVTLQKTRSKRVAMDTVQMATAVLASKAFEAGTTKRKVVCTGHGVKAGDLIRVTSGTQIYVELNVKYVIDVDNFVLDGAFSAAPAALDTFDHLVYITQRVGASGAMPVDVVSSVLPTGASTSANQVLEIAAINAIKDTDGIKKITDAVVISNITGTVSLPTGASTLAEQQTQTTALGTINTSVGTVNTTLGTTNTNTLNTANSVATIATNTARLAAKQPLLHDAGSVTIPSASWLDIATAGSAIKEIQVVQNGGGYFYLKDEDAAAELAIIPAGFSGNISFVLASGKKLQAKAIGADITSGKIAINFLG